MYESGEEEEFEKNMLYRKTIKKVRKEQAPASKKKLVDNSGLQKLNILKKKNKKMNTKDKALQIMKKRKDANFVSPKKSKPSKEQE